jgi:hypothetical protein
LGLSQEGGKGCGEAIKFLGKIKSGLHFRSPAELNFSLNDFCTHHITSTCCHKWSPSKNSVTCLASCLFADSVTSVGANDFYFAVIEWPAIFCIMLRWYYLNKARNLSEIEVYLWYHSQVRTSGQVGPRLECSPETSHGQFPSGLQQMSSSISVRFQTYMEI